MDVRLNPAKEARLTKIAAQRGLTGEELARQIISRYLEEDKTFIDVEPAANERGGLGTEIAALFSKHGLDFVLESPFDPSPKTAGLRPADSRGRQSPRKSSRSRRKKRA